MKIAELLSQSQTMERLRAFSDSQAQSILLSGPNGSGKRQLAELVVARKLAIKIGAIAQNPHILQLERLKNKTEISIDQIRAVTTELAKTTTGQKQWRRAVLIYNAQYLNVEAQNALLKTLEEPPADTVFVITVAHIGDLLPTVTSRIQHVAVASARLEDSKEYLRNTYETTEIEQAWRLSGGRSELMLQLLEAGGEHGMRRAIDDAKDFLQADTFTRLKLIDELSKEKAHIGHFLEALLLIGGSMQRRPNQTQHQSQRTLRLQRIVLETQQALESKAQPKLALMLLATHI